MINESELQLARHTFTALSQAIHSANVKQGWYKNPKNGRAIQRNIGEMLMLIVSEISEGMEGHRKSLDDTHLPEFKMIEVELADALIRIFDLAGYQDYRLGEAFVAKMIYNSQRADHKLENRAKSDGKKY